MQITGFPPFIRTAADPDEANPDGASASAADINVDAGAVDASADAANADAADAANAAGQPAARQHAGHARHAAHGRSLNDWLSAMSPDGGIGAAQIEWQMQKQLLAMQQPSSASTNPANMSASNDAVKLVKKSEDASGPHLTAYRDSGGKPTIGYGHTGQVNGKPIIPGKTTITPAQADQLLPGDLATAEAAVRNNVHVPITQGQFDALTDFTFNLGAGKLEGSTLLTKLNAKDYAGAQAEFSRWVYGKEKDPKTGKEVEVKLPGLVTRRAAEAALFGNQGPQAAASAVKAAGQ
ncbi:MAG: lysozyme [Burkholderiaceae bacterium]|jgi:lysozyme|nr:lysozyme [Burkholderiaceae bacterium]